MHSRICGRYPPRGGHMSMICGSGEPYARRLITGQTRARGANPPANAAAAAGALRRARTRIQQATSRTVPAPCGLMATANPHRRPAARSTAVPAGCADRRAMRIAATSTSIRGTSLLVSDSLATPHRTKLATRTAAHAVVGP